MGRAAILALPAGRWLPADRVPWAEGWGRIPGVHSVGKPSCRVYMRGPRVSLEDEQIRPMSVRDTCHLESGIDTGVDGSCLRDTPDAGTDRR